MNKLSFIYRLLFNEKFRTNWFDEKKYVHYVTFRFPETGNRWGVVFSTSAENHSSPSAKNHSSPSAKNHSSPSGVLQGDI